MNIKGAGSFSSEVKKYQFARVGIQDKPGVPKRSLLCRPQAADTGGLKSQRNGHPVVYMQPEIAGDLKAVHQHQFGLIEWNI